MPDAPPCDCEAHRIIGAIEQARTWLEEHDLEPS
jgi:hypothetical protein